jgi:nucleotide-binding universal stress UspA family protein
MPTTHPTTITCGTDFSDGARRAAAVAAALAVRFGARLQLVHVVDDLGAELTFAQGDMSAYEPRRQTLEADAAELRRAYPVAIDTVFEPGVADAHLVDTARRAQSALLVVSALGRTRQHARWLLGSIAERVAQTATVPVLVVRDGRGLIEWASGTRPLRVMVGVDDGAPARAALDWVGELRQQAPCDLQIVRIVLPSEAHARLGVPPPVPLEGLRPMVERLLRRELRRWAGDIPGEGAVSWLVEGSSGRVDSPLLHEARRTAADVVVVGTNQRAGLARAWQGSVSRHVLHAADGDVVTVPASSRRLTSVARHDRVLVATDFSDLANRAIGVAYGLVPRNGVVHLAHVTEASEDTGARSARERLAALVPTDASARGVVTVLEVVDDAHVADALLQLGARRGVDAICLATHGRTGISQAILGSVAQQVVRQARCPVVLVPRHCTPQPVGPGL